MQDRTHRGFNGTPYSLDGHTHTNLNSDGFSPLINPISVRAATTQSVNGGVTTKIKFGTIDYDPNLVWDSLNNRYVAESDGIYSALAVMRLTTSKSCKLMLYKNGSFYRSLQDNYTVGSNSPFYQGESGIQLALNDFIEIWTLTNASCTIASTDTYFCARRVY